MDNLWFCSDPPVQTDLSATSCTLTSGTDLARGSLPLLCTAVTLPHTKDYNNPLPSATLVKHYHSKLALHHVTNHKPTTKHISSTQC